MPKSDAMNEAKAKLEKAATWKDILPFPKECDIEEKYRKELADFALFGTAPGMTYVGTYDVAAASMRFQFEGSRMIVAVCMEELAAYFNSKENNKANNDGNIIASKKPNVSSNDASNKAIDMASDQVSDKSR